MVQMRLATMAAQLAVFLGAVLVAVLMLPVDFQAAAAALSALVDQVAV
jgi:Zn-dependent membrane protease YugP